MISIACRTRTQEFDGGHTSVTVFAGPDKDHRALVGMLICKPSEADEIVRRLEAGA